VYVLWALPSVGWLMLCSAWARSKVFLWAVAIPVVSGLLVWWFDIMGLFNQSTAWFWTHVVLRSLGSVIPATSLTADMTQLAGMSAHDMDVMHLGQTYQALGTANLWIGVAVGAALLAATAWLRRWRNDD